MISTILGMTAASGAVSAAEDAYVPWTFDDFDSHGEIVEPVQTQAVEVVTVAPVADEDEEAGELGW